MDATLQELTAHLRQLTITSISPKPMVIEGTLCDLPFMLRYRSGSAVLSVGGGKLDPLYRAYAEYGSEWSSTLTPQEVVVLLEQLIPLLERAPRQWAFAGPDGTESHVGWGQTPEEARQAIADSYRLAGLSVPAMDEVSYTIDERIWPEPEPNFKECV